MTHNNKLYFLQVIPSTYIINITSSIATATNVLYMIIETLFWPIHKLPQEEGAI